MNANQEPPREITSALPLGDPSTKLRGGRDSPTDSRDRSAAASALASSNSLTGFRLAGAGLELAASTLLMGALGYWVDSARGHGTPSVALAGLLVGFSAGLYRLIVLAMKTVEREQSPRNPES